MSVKSIAAFKGSKQGQMRGSNHDKWLKIDCYSVIPKNTTGQTLGSNPLPSALFSGVTITRTLDSASPALNQAFLTNEPLHVVIEERLHSLVLRKTTLHNAIIGRIQPPLNYLLGASSGGWADVEMFLYSGHIEMSH